MEIYIVDTQICKMLDIFTKSVQYSKRDATSTTFLQQITGD